MSNFDSALRATLAALSAFTAGTFVAIAATLGVLVVEALTGLHIAAATVGAAIGLGYSVTVWRWLQK